MNNDDEAKHDAGEKSIAEGVNELRSSQKRPPKRKKGRFSRSPKGGNNQKQSTYDFNAARDAIGIADANSQQIISCDTIQSGPNPSAPKSPLKSEYKRMLKAEVAKVGELIVENTQLQKDVDAGKRMVVSVKGDNRRLADALQDEKRKSRVTIAKLLKDAESVMAESNNILKQAKNMEVATDGLVVMERQQGVEMLHQERVYNATQVAACKYYDITYYIVPLL